jgi:hypothetical protein
VTQRAVSARAWTTVTLLGLCCTATPAAALDIKLWPVIDYHRDAGGTTLHLLGPLFAYETGDGASTITLRPLFSLRRGPRAHDNQFTVLYPLFVSRWDTTQTEVSLFGLVNYTTQPARRPDEWDERFTAFPFVFYRHSIARGTSLSVLPFYADLRDVFGYERVRMIAFPFYLTLQEPLAERTWMPFPFVSWAGGTLGHGWRVFPFYGWNQDGETNRFTYVMWPFYISDERHFTRPEREHRLILFPFYSHVESPTVHSRTVGLLTHTIDDGTHTETWSFPWPFCVSQRDLRTGERTGLRVAPFYEDTHFGDVHSHFVLWPLVRWSSQEVDDYRHTRSDVLLVLYRNIDEVQLTNRHHRHLRTLFPLFRIWETDDAREFSTLATFDALLPRNPTIQHLYAPLWQLYTRRQEAEAAARWSLLWDLVSSDGTRVRYPVQFDLSP